MVTSDGSTTWKQKPTGVSTATATLIAYDASQILIWDYATRISIVSPDAGQTWQTTSAAGILELVGDDCWRDGPTEIERRRNLELAGLATARLGDRIRSPQRNGPGCRARQRRRCRSNHRRWFDVESRAVLDAIRETHPYVRGWSGYLSRSLDDGAHWAAVGAPRDDFRAIAFAPDAQHGWVVGSAAILFTQDGGGTWTSQPVEDFASLESIFVLDAQTAWTTTYDGTVLATATAGQ